ncbi:MAG: hypothetical protein HPY83_09970 [Anaerolineae bacterium]|nr:hypothetical protein [Anaerolineae bacterium]
MAGSRFLPAGILGLVIVVALALMGVAYALWTDTLEVSGTVNTGEVEAVVILGEVDEGRYVNNGVNDDLEAESRDVALCRATLGAGPLRGNPGDNGPDRLHMEIINAYPGYRCYVELGVANAGSIPIKVQPPATANVQHPGEDVSVSLVDCWTEDLLLRPGQRSTGEDAYPTCRVYIAVGSSATESTAYSFEGRFTAYQWNKTY